MPFAPVFAVVVPPPRAARHCPFLNREDDRCAARLTVGRLGDVFGRCCGDYAGCPAYREMLAERVAARAEAQREPHDAPSPPAVVAPSAA